MRVLCWVLAVLLSASALAQEKAPKKTAAKKPVAKKQAAHKPAAHSKPTPEQIRKFNELQKKR